jgi:hypothetical protein
MSAEAPIQVDLSQDNSWDKISDEMLSNHEKKLLAEQFKEESEGIIYLTQQELDNFKNILQTQDINLGPSVNTVMGNEMQSFVTEQLSEWLSSQDILSNIEWLPEWIWNSLDKHSEEILFGPEWVLKSLDLSDAARDNIITSLSMSVLWKLSDTSVLSWNISELFKWITDNLSILQNLVNQKIQLPIGWEVSSLSISAAWDRNYIFSDANVWKDFFDFISGETVSEDNIRKYIEERNLPIWSETNITNNLSGLWIDAQEHLQSIIWVISTTDDKDRNTDWVINTDLDNLPTEDDLDDMEEKWGLFAMFAKMIREFMQWIIKFWEDAWLVDDSNEEKDEPKSDTPEEIAPTTIETWRGLFRTKLSEWNISPFTIWEIQKLFPEQWELTQTAKDIITTIDTISGEDNFESKFNNIFSQREWKETTKFEEFVKASNNTLILEWKSEWENMLSILKKYNEYRQWGTWELYIKYFERETEEESAQN